MDDPVIEEVAGSTPELAQVLAQAGLPIDDLDEPGRRFFRFTEGGRLVGFVGWEAGDGTDALLRSLVVVPARRGAGDGTQMINWALTRLAELGFTDAWALTTTIEPLARRLGFARADRAAAPQIVTRSRQFAQLCPSTALLLHRRLP
ncbi:MAG TPA: GNAT family N-acetyltransferase [Magnetospirillum sp.]|nr:GNAT family N-acetyltransferase [Magnetospirillum sp.]